MRPVRDPAVDRNLRRLVRAAQAGDSRAENEICGIVRNGVDKLSYDFFFPGAEHDDVVQWGMMGVVSGIRSYDAAAETGPEMFSWLLFCARRGIITGLKAMRRDKHRPLNDALLFEHPVHSKREGEPNEQPFTFHDVLADGTDLFEQLVEKEQLHALVSAFRRLTALERRAMR